MRNIGYVCGTFPTDVVNKNVKYSLVISEKYLDGKSYTYVEQTIYFKQGTFPTGFGTGTLTVTNCDDTTTNYNVAFAGTWEQVNSGNIATVPFLYGYC